MFFKYCSVILIHKIKITSCDKKHISIIGDLSIKKIYQFRLAIHFRTFCTLLYSIKTLRDPSFKFDIKHPYVNKKT